MLIGAFFSIWSLWMKERREAFGWLVGSFLWLSLPTLPPLEREGSIDLELDHAISRFLEEE